MRDAIEPRPELVVRTIPDPVPAAFVKILADLSSSTCGGPIGKMLLISYRRVLPTRSVHTSVATV